jgi:6-carboxyhexanoate--CoA ligase
MRGAMVIDARSGARLEHDHARGIRATRFDWSDRAVADRDRILISLGLAHFRTSEALALATKIAHGPGVLAELCWSDDPDYTAGYAASLTMGYVRFPVMKEPGNAFGGRAIFIRDAACLQDLTAYLEEQAVLIDSIGGAFSEADLESYLLTRTGAHVRT